MEKRSKTNKFFCWILTIILMIEIIAISVLSIANNTILKKSYIEAQLEKTGFYTQIKGNIEEMFKNYVLQANLDDEIVENLITDDKIKQDVNQVLEAVYNQKAISVETDTIKTELQNRINQKLMLGKNITITKEAQKSINDFIDIIINNYKSNMEISESAIKQIGNMVGIINTKITKYSNVLYITTIATAILLAIICFARCKNKKSILNIYHAIALLASGSTLIITWIISKIQIKPDNIIIYNKAITNLLISIIKNIQANILQYGIVLFSVGLIISIIENIRLKDKE